MSAQLAFTSSRPLREVTHKRLDCGRVEQNTTSISHQIKTTDSWWESTRLRQPFDFVYNNNPPHIKTVVLQDYDTWLCFAQSDWNFIEEIRAYQGVFRLSAASSILDHHHMHCLPQLIGLLRMFCAHVLNTYFCTNMFIYSHSLISLTLFLFFVLFLNTFYRIFFFMTNCIVFSFCSASVT